MPANRTEMPFGTRDRIGGSKSIASHNDAQQPRAAPSATGGGKAQDQLKTLLAFEEAADYLERLTDPPPILAQLAVALRARRRGAVDSLDWALGLGRGQGLRLKHVIAYYDRDRYLRQAAEMLKPGGTVVEKRRALVAAHDAYLSDYAQHRLLSECPEHLIGTAEEFIWRAKKAHCSFPSSEVAVETILRELSDFNEVS